MVVVHAAEAEVEADRSLWVQGQPDLQELASGQAPKLQRNPVLKNKTAGEKRKKKRKNSFLLKHGRQHGWEEK